MPDKHPLLFKAKTVWSADKPPFESFACLAGRILATGSYRDLRGAYADAKVVELGDTFVMPGFNDAHQHLSLMARQNLHLDVSPDSAPDRTKLKSRIRAVTHSKPRGTWVLAFNYSDEHYPEGRLRRDELDEIAPEHPVLVEHVSGHWGVTNTLGLTVLGSPSVNGVSRGDDASAEGVDESAGVLYEQALFDAIYPALSRGRAKVNSGETKAAYRAELSRLVSYLHSLGITSITDALVGEGEFESYVELARSENLFLRVNMLSTFKTVPDLAEWSHTLRGFSDRLKLGGIKLFVDGAISGRTCLVDEPFLGTEDTGRLVTPYSELRDQVRKVHNAGSRVAAHANGERAIRYLLRTLEEDYEDRSYRVARPRVEHCSIIDEGILSRLKALDAIVVPFASYASEYGDLLLKYYGPRRLERMFAHRSLIDRGIDVAGASDSPCASANPLLGVQSCVTRGDERDGSGLTQRISLSEALRIYTVGSAVASGEQTHKGRLSPGHIADFIVLEANPFEEQPHELTDIRVLQTYIGGELRWSIDERDRRASLE